MKSQMRTRRQRCGRETGGLRPPLAGRSLAGRSLAGRSLTGGFTLVEMMVSVTLVVIMMLMFAQIFEIAAGSVSVQRGLAENSQRARTVVTVLRGDLDKRTFRLMIPIAPNEGQPLGLTGRGERRGYFYISENDPFDDTDDVLQFTVDATLDVKNKNRLPYYGRAKLLAPSNHINQPGWDDGQPGSGAATSRAAEVSYVLRNGVLYRRVMLIREPLETTNPEPQYNNDTPMIPGPYDENVDPDPVNGLSDMWNDFGFSIYFDPDKGGPRFHGLDSLDNSGESGFVSLGIPSMRFGHNHANGQPFEFALNDGAREFVGRYTQEETSHPLFGYPGRIPDPPIGNPMLRTIDRPVINGVVDAFRGGPRRAEDVLLTNVHSFDVKVWDGEVGDFVDIGHNRTNDDGDPIGHYHRFRNALPAYGPRVYPTDVLAGDSDNRIYDTWHRNVELGLNAAGDPFDPPPYRPTVDGTPTGTPIPLRAIQITLRFLDVSSDQMRQLTIVHSLVD
jgi:type II secretory pathway component PulJ